MWSCRTIESYLLDKNKAYKKTYSYLLNVLFSY